MDHKLIQKTHTEIKDVLSSVYRKRQATLLFQKVMWLITGIYVVFMVMNILVIYFPNTDSRFLSFFKLFQATPEHPYANLYPIVGLVVLLYPITFFFTNRFRHFKLTETKAIAKMVKSLFPDVDFAQNTKAPDKQIIDSKLFASIKKTSPIYSYGQIRRKANDTEINIADIGITELNASNKIASTLMNIPGINVLVMMYQFVLKNIFSNKSADAINYTFRGMFCWMNFKKKLNGHTVVLPNTQSTKLDRATSFNFKEEERIHLEDPRFTEQFVVYSTDQVEARYVLSAALMERIVSLKEKFDQPILLSFQNRQMFLAVKNENGIFSFPSGKIDTIETIEELAHDIETALEIASALKLN